MKLLIIGSEGFIGSNCIRHFVDGNHEVFGVDLFEQPTQKYGYIKISRLSPELDDLFTAHEFDAVVNAAGSGNVSYSMTHPVLDFEANSLDTIMILDAIRKHRPNCKYVHISSAAVYGNPSSIPVLEDDPTVPLSPYGWHKLIAERLCEEYSMVYGIRTVRVRPFSVFGPGLKKQMFWELYQKLESQEESLEVWGTGDESRDYIYISDLVLALDIILQRAPLRGEVYNLASGAETSIKNAVTLFVNAIGKKPLLRFNNLVRPGDPLNWKADISKIGALGFRNKVSLAEGIEILAQWYNKGQSRK